MADDLLAAVQRFRSPRGGRIDLPGAPAKAGVVSDGLEGFARTFLLAAFRAAGDEDGKPVEPYLDGLVSGPWRQRPGRVAADRLARARRAADGGVGVGGARAR